MKYFLNIVLLLVLFRQANGQCLTPGALWDSIIVLRGSDVPDSIQLSRMHSFISKASSCGYQHDSVYILLLQRTGALYSYQNDLQRALSYTWQAVKNYNQIASRMAISPALQVKNYFNLFIFYDGSGDDRNVEKVVDSCILISLHSAYSDNYTLDALIEKSAKQLETGDYHGCIKTAQLDDILNREKTGKLSQDERDKQIVLFSARLNALIFLQQYFEAEKLLENRKSEYIQVKNGLHLGNWYALMGKIRRRQNKFEETIFLLKKSIPAHLKAGYKEGAAESLNNIGFVYLDNLHQYNRALPYFHEALRYSSKAESLNIYANIGNTYVRLKDFNSAFLAFQNALDQISPGINEAELISSADSSLAHSYAEYLLRLAIYKGDAYMAYYKASGNVDALNNAIAVYKYGDQLLNKMKSQQSDFQSKLFWRSDARHLYEHGIEAARLANNPSVALYFFEKSRAVLLSDEIQLRRLLTKQEFERYSAIKALITTLESTGQWNAGEYKQQQLFTYRLELKEIEKIIRERRLTGDQEVVTMKEIHNKILNNYQVFVQMYCGDSAVYMLLISKKVSVLKKISRKEYDTVVKKYTGYLSDPASLNRNFKDFIDVASRLYSLLFNGINLPSGRIVIAADGIPFPIEALVSSPKGAAIKYIIEDNAISYTYNARYFIDGSPGKHKSKSFRFSAFAPVNFPGELKLQSLDGSNRSIELIGNYFSRSNKFALAHASRASFITNYSNSDIILLYTHGAYKSDRNEPVLYFSDSALYLSELAGEQNPRTRLIVLAACESGLGSNYTGEGVFSFSRGFAAIGIPCSITTLWSVNKEATFAITERFYEYLAQGNPADISLQKAKLDLIKRSASLNNLPYYWAGPILIGNNEPLNNTLTWSTTIWIVLSVITISLIVFFAIRWLKKL